MIIPDNYAQVNLFFTGAAVPSGAEVTIGIFDSLATRSPVEVATDVFIAFGSVVAFLTPQITMSKALCKFGPNETGPAAEFSGAVTGGNGTNSLAPNTSLLVSKNTSHGGRKGRGRMFVPGFREDKVGPGGVVDAGELPGVQTAVNTFQSSLEADDYTLVLLHGDTTLPYSIDSLTVSSTVATQRRRLRR